MLTTIEVVDDVAFEFDDGTAREVLQVKHHQRSLRDLIDTSADLWRTLGIWSGEWRDGSADEGRVMTLMTTRARPSRRSPSARATTTRR